MWEELGTFEASEKKLRMLNQPSLQDGSTGSSEGKTRMQIETMPKFEHY